MTDSETIKANFPFPIIPREPGLPTFQIVNDVHNKSKANAASISSSLGGGAHGVFGIGLSSATYHQIMGYHFIRPNNPGALPQDVTGTAVKLFFVLADLFAHCNCSSGDVLREGAWIVGPDEMRSCDLMVRGRGEADTKEPVCSPAEGRRN